MARIADDAETRNAVTQLIQRAWADEAFKVELIADTDAMLRRLGVRILVGHRIEFYDDPTARIGDWSSIERVTAMIVRVPIPARPEGEAVLSAELAEISGGGWLPNSLVNTLSGAGLGPIPARRENDAASPAELAGVSGGSQALPLVAGVTDWLLPIFNNGNE